MTDYSKSPNNLGIKLHEQFCKGDNAPLVLISHLVTDEQITDEAVKDDEGEGVIGNISEQWGLKDTSLVLKTLRNLEQVIPTSIAHADSWKFLLRTAQCAALADQRLEVELVDLPNIADDPYVIAMETIYKLGKGSFELMAKAIGTGFFDDPEWNNSSWNDSSKEKLATICVKPNIFPKMVKPIIDFGNPDKKTALFNEGSDNTMQALLRASTAAAVVGKSFQIEFVPFGSPR